MLSNEQIERLAEILDEVSAAYGRDGQARHIGPEFLIPYAQQSDRRKNALRTAVVRITDEYESMRAKMGREEM